MKPESVEATIARADEVLEKAERFLPKLDADLLDQVDKEEEEEDE